MFLTPSATSQGGCIVVLPQGCTTGSLGCAWGQGALCSGQGSAECEICTGHGSGQLWGVLGGHLLLGPALSKSHDRVSSAAGCLDFFAKMWACRMQHSVLEQMGQREQLSAMEEATQGGTEVSEQHRGHQPSLLLAVHLSQSSQNVLKDSAHRCGGVKRWSVRILPHF